MEKPLEFFDCDCSFGKRSIVNPGSFHKLEDLLDRMKLYGIGKALVYHSMAREYDPMVGNEMLSEELGKDLPLCPVWVVMHHHTEEFPKPEELLFQMKKNHIRAVRMFPGNSDHAYSIARWNCGELLSMLEANKIPLLIGMDQLNWNELYSLLSDFPGLPIILSGVGYGSNRNLYSLLQQFENLYLETIGYKTHNGIEEICRKFGAGRLVFGSGMPLFSGASAVSMISYARISEAEKRMIAGENLNRLLQYL
ncbi:MAG: amidohydrolase family protein [Clostridiaceae bacterium]